MMPTILAYDIEANGRREIVIDQKGVVHPEVTEVHCICTQDVETGERHQYTSRVPNELALGFQELMGADLLIAHNGVDYDMPVLRRLVAPSWHDPASEPKQVDTLIWSRYLYPDVRSHPNLQHGAKPNSLETWGKRLGINKIQYDGTWDRLTNDMLTYCKQDVVVLIAIYQYLLPRMEKWKAHSRMEHEFSRIIARQSCNGVGFNGTQALEFEAQLIEEKAGLLDSLRETFPPRLKVMKQCWWVEPGPDTMLRVRYEFKKDAPKGVSVVRGSPKTQEIPFNPGSTQQIADRLRERYRWEPTDLTPTGQAQITESILATLPYPEAGLLNHYMMVGKRLSMLADWITRSENSRDGRIHGSVNTNGTPTARCTHSQPNQTQVTKVKHDEDGKVLLGYPGRYGYESRSLFGPRDGWVQVGADATGLELCMLANRTWPFDDGRYAQILIEHDVHEYNLKHIPVLQTRDQAKEGFYAGIYGAGVWKQGHTLINHWSLSPQQREKYKGLTPEYVGSMFRDQLHEQLPSLGQATAQCRAWCKQRGYLILLDGRRAPIRSEHLALNTQLQGDGAVLCKLALILADRSLTDMTVELETAGHDYGWEWMINAHDEMQLECEHEIAEMCGEIMAESYAEAGRRLRCKVPTPGEYKIGKNWAETH